MGTLARNGRFGSRVRNRGTRRGTDLLRVPAARIGGCASHLASMHRSPMLSRAQLTTYSLGGLAMNLTNLVVSQWLYERYVVGGVLAPAVFSIVLLAGRITDGVSDPFVAFWTDNVRTKRGRRIPFLLFGALPFAIVCLLLWTPPVAAAPWIRTLYSVIVTQLFFLGYALVVTPYLALLPEIAG